MASSFDDTIYDYDGPIVSINGPLARGLVNATCLESMYPGSTAEVSKPLPSCPPSGTERGL